jgi:hypothetical protein
MTRRQSRRTAFADMPVGMDLASGRWVASHTITPTAGPRLTRSVTISSSSAPWVGCSNITWHSSTANITGCRPRSARDARASVTLDSGHTSLGRSRSTLYRRRMSDRRRPGGVEEVGHVVLVVAHPVAVRDEGEGVEVAAALEVERVQLAADVQRRRQEQEPEDERLAHPGDAPISPEANMSVTVTGLPHWSTPSGTGVNRFTVPALRSGHRTGLASDRERSPTHRMSRAAWVSASTLGPHAPQRAAQAGGEPVAALDDVRGRHPGRQVDRGPPPGTVAGDRRREGHRVGGGPAEVLVQLPDAQRPERGQDQFAGQAGRGGGRGEPGQHGGVVGPAQHAEPCRAVSSSATRGTGSTAGEESTRRRGPRTHLCAVMSIANRGPGSALLPPTERTSRRPPRP